MLILCGVPCVSRQAHAATRLYACPTGARAPTRLHAARRQVQAFPLWQSISVPERRRETTPETAPCSGASRSPHAARLARDQSSGRGARAGGALGPALDGCAGFLRSLSTRCATSSTAFALLDSAYPSSRPSRPWQRSTHNRVFDVVRSEFGIGQRDRNLLYLPPRLFALIRITHAFQVEIGQRERQFDAIALFVDDFSLKERDLRSFVLPDRSPAPQVGRVEIEIVFTIDRGRSIDFFQACQ